MENDKIAVVRLDILNECIDSYIEFLKKDLKQGIYTKKSF